MEHKEEMGQWLGKTSTNKNMSLYNTQADQLKWIIETDNPQNFEYLWRRVSYIEYRSRNNAALDDTEIQIVRDYINKEYISYI